jgi:DNA-binding NarL/FixJ family response regulator
VQSPERRVQVGTGLLKRRVSEHVLDVVHRPSGLEATRQIVKESPQTEVLVLTMHHSEQLARDDGPAKAVVTSR